MGRFCYENKRILHIKILKNVEKKSKCSVERNADPDYTVYVESKCGVNMI